MRRWQALSQGLQPHPKIPEPPPLPPGLLGRPVPPSATKGSTPPGFLASPSSERHRPFRPAFLGSPGPSRPYPRPWTRGRACPGCRCSGIRCPLPVCAERAEHSARAAGATRFRLGAGPSAGPRRPPCSSLRTASGAHLPVVRKLARRSRPEFRPVFRALGWPPSVVVVGTQLASGRGWPADSDPLREILFKKDSCICSSWCSLAVPSLRQILA